MDKVSIIPISYKTIKTGITKRQSQYYSDFILKKIKTGIRNGQSQY